jgi:hypothetical protein
MMKRIKEYLPAIIIIPALIVGIYFLFIRKSAQEKQDAANKITKDMQDVINYIKFDSNVKVDSILSIGLYKRYNPVTIFDLEDYHTYYFQQYLIDDKTYGFYSGKIGDIEKVDDNYFLYFLDGKYVHLKLFCKKEQLPRLTDSTRTGYGDFIFKTNDITRENNYICESRVRY